VFTCATATLFIVGRRTRKMVQHVLGEHFNNWLMSDGYHVYRDRDQRLRCLAHLLRKAHGLAESLEPQAQAFGHHVLDVLETVIAAVYEARGAPERAAGLRERHAPTLNALLDDCRPSVPCAIGSSRGASAWAPAPRKAPAPSRCSPALSKPAASAMPHLGIIWPRSCANVAAVCLHPRCLCPCPPAESLPAG